VSANVNCLKGCSGVAFAKFYLRAKCTQINKTRSIIYAKPEYCRRCMSKQFELVSEFEPAGDQPSAIKALVEGLENGEMW
jgi:hypothetical protein